MLPYWILIAVWTAGAVQYSRAGSAVKAWPLFWAALLFTAALIGFRFHVGGDWGSYERMFGDTSLLDAQYLITNGDPAYTILNWVVAKAGFGIVTVNLVCALFVVWGLGRFAARQPNPWLIVASAAPYFIIVVAMGYTRQAVAIAIIMAALSSPRQYSIARVFLYIFGAALFHKTAVLVVPIMAVAFLRRNIVVAMLTAAVFILLYFLLLNSSADKLVTYYAKGSYDSQGAAIRVAMDVVAALIFFAFRKRMRFNDFEQATWLAFSAFAIACIPALIFVSASSGVDRIALFLTPLQLIAFGRLPYAINKDHSVNKAALIGVVIYCFAVQFSWLNYAANSFYWLPYQFALTADTTGS